MKDELFDEEAWVCTDCLFLMANGDAPNYAYQYPEKTEAECAEMTRDYFARIADETAGYNLTLGHGREQHDCASNWEVQALLKSDRDGEDWKEGDAKEYRADTASEAIEQAEFDFAGDDVVGFRALGHDLETEGDRGGECECETDNFSHRTCANCKDSFAGTWHAATIWKITEE